MLRKRLDKIVLSDRVHVRIEPAKTGDIGEIVAIENRSYPFPWSQKVLLHEITGKAFSYVYVARLWNGSGPQGKIIGYNFFWVVTDEVHILNIAVEPEYRGYGLGKRLMLFAVEFGREQGAARVLLEVRASNTAAQQLYAGLGFQKIGIRKKYYVDNKEDAYVMQKKIFP